MLSAEGGRVPSEGVMLHLEGDIQSSYGDMMLSEGGILHSKGGTTSPEGGIMPSVGGGEDILPQRAAGYLLRAALAFRGGILPSEGDMTFLEDSILHS